MDMTLWKKFLMSLFLLISLTITASAYEEMDSNWVWTNCVKSDLNDQYIEGSYNNYFVGMDSAVYNPKENSITFWMKDEYVEHNELRQVTQEAWGVIPTTGECWKMYSVVDGKSITNHYYHRKMKSMSHGFVLPDSYVEIGVNKILEKNHAAPVYKTTPPHNWEFLKNEVSPYNEKIYTTWSICTDTVILSSKKELGAVFVKNKIHGSCNNGGGGVSIYKFGLKNRTIAGFGEKKMRKVKPGSLEELIYNKAQELFVKK